MAASSAAGGDSSVLDIRVGEPQSQGEGRSQFTTYRIASSQRGIERFTDASYEVVRRYSDFDWLRARLLMVAPTVAVPPLPPKDGLPMKNFGTSFIESRNRGLQRFVDRIASHPRLRVAEPVFQFLALDEAAFAEVKAATKTKMAESMQKGVLSFVSAAGSALGSAVDRVRGTGGASGPKTAADLSFEELGAYVDGVHAALVRAEAATGAMLAKRKDAAIRMMEYGRAYETLGGHEKEELGETLAAIGSVTQRQAQMEAMQAAGELRWFREDLRDAVAVAEAAQAAFRYRDQVSHRLQASKEALEKRRVMQDQVRGDAAKSQSADASVKVAMEEVEAARAAFVLANNELLDEVAHLRAMRLADTRQMLLDFAVMESMRGEAAENLWRGVVPKAEAAAKEEERKVEQWRREGGDTRAAAAAVRASSAEAPAPAAAASASASAPAPAAADADADADADMPTV